MKHTLVPRLQLRQVLPVFLHFHNIRENPSLPNVIQYWLILKKTRLRHEDAYSLGMINSLNTLFFKLFFPLPLSSQNVTT